MPRGKRGAPFLTAMIWLATSACGSSPAATGDDCPGATAGSGGFELTVAGAQAAEVCGIATSLAGTGGNGWAIKLLSTTDITNITIYTDMAGRPAPGTYAIADYTDTGGSPDPGDYVALAVFDQASLGTTLTSVAGTLTITSSSAGQVAGSFEFTARNGTAGPADITMTGTFTADTDDD